mgnify:FL=1
MIFTEIDGIGLYLQNTVYILYYLQALLYLFLYIRLIKNLKDYKSKEPAKFNIPIVNWIIIYIAGTATFEMLAFITSFNYPNRFSIIFEQTASLAYLFFAGFLGINQSKFLIQTRFYQTSIKVTNENSSVPAKDCIEEDEKKELKRLIEVFLKERKLFLDPNLKLETLARKIHIPQKKLSQAIHDVYGKNFTSFINDYRIQEAINILNSEEKISMYVLCHNVGFNSRSTFNRAFKDYTGETPRDYVIKHKISNDS